MKPLINKQFFHRALMLVLALVLCVPALWPLTHQGFFHLHDWTHVARLAEMDLALRDGHFPVRWSKNLGYGYGLPQFNFYAPLPYYLAELFHLIGFSYLASIKLLVAVNFWVSFLVMYALVKGRWKFWAGMVAATAFIYIPYRAVDTYVRGAFGELTAITMLAITVWCLLSWIKNPSRRWAAGTALAIGGLVTAHNLVAFISLPVIGIFGAVMHLVVKKWRQLAQFLGIIILGLSLGAFYLIPALGEKQWTTVDQLTQGFSDYHQHFLYLRQFFQQTWGYGGSIYGLEDDISFAIGWVQVALAIVGAATILYFRQKRYRSTTSLIVMSGIIVLWSMYMSSFKAEPLWDLLAQWYKYVQFPWRYLSLIIVFIPILNGASMRWRVGADDRITIVLAVFCIGSLILANVAYFRPETYLANADELYFHDPSRIQSRMSEIIPDFTPVFGKTPPIIPPTQRFKIIPEPTNWSVDVDRTAQFHLTLTSPRESTVAANILYFPGWQWFVNGVGVAPMIDPKTGTMAVTVPEGRVTVSGRFGETNLRSISDLISIAALLIVIYLFLPSKQQLDEVYGRV